MKFKTLGVLMTGLLLFCYQNSAHSFSLDRFKSMLPPSTETAPKSEPAPQNNAAPNKEASSEDVDSILSSALSKGGAKQKQALNDSHYCPVNFECTSVTY